MAKANVDVSEDIAVILGGPSESQDSKAVVASEEGARGVARESLHKVETKLLERAAELLLLVGFKLHISQFGAARHEPSGTV